ncbi:cation:dicarboxylase symporter family transporter [Bacillus lacus]|uniref:Cation:dicarboxylase symporter family transporter n=1 Tax=Metabacillus lacus TaxID=1983721 RepID=A0A7X2IZL3_9BACI|nr:dicarboxylate/amino acid:cation symporter [Metabacillus lacus]MRX72387.1 cation:dicarboxylase symporter family transporter [Metabacillus lacus]
MKKFGLLPKIIAAIILGIIAGNIAPEPVIRFFATFNGLFGGFIGFAIPLIIIGFIAPGISQIGKGAGKLLGLTILFAYGSTVLAGLLAYTAGSQLLPGFISGSTLQNMENPEEFLLEGFFKVEMAPVMGVMTALLFAFVLGIGTAAVNAAALQRVLEDFRSIIEKLITVIIIPLLPFHIFGIFANMTFGGQVQDILSIFARVFLLIILLHFTMLLIQFTASGLLTRSNPLKLFKTMLPAYFTALGTQSSAATIPVTLRQVKTTSVKSKIADFSVPLLATIHLSGSTITITSLGMGVMLLHGDMPILSSMLPFIFMLGITMIAAPGVPGGAVVAASGLFMSMLGFSETMVTLMIALYLAQDSFGTAANVTGDGALTMLLNRFSKNDHHDSVSS